MESHLNSAGRGKGVATFYREPYALSDNITANTYQMTKVSSESEDIINVYRSEGTKSDEFLVHLMSLLNFERQITIVGDFNICAVTEKDHVILKTLKLLGFNQEVVHSTHVDGHVLDHVYLFTPRHMQAPKYRITHSSTYFTDHDMIFVSKVFIKIA